ncbi:hypothetical protein GLAREA_09457 [Glarea lozoyensis ATCC 20868]|uniref:Uncharacterized protein n=1 Tax=Glarea lozoyensis (strain ATCC 20868 / MF5171) TaxID=1116229 RepID=S3CPF6_GLAL2|nr:uncharacterized protein GLAREA_09457 [Glarea lozoyensis ATCC 20868]EPE28337.1 hypothetical protein GLAREA_09457 [Glarea lozoyensis ATCC 20868]
MSLTPSTLYYASAIINLATIPKHFLVGQNHVSKSIAAIPPTPDLARGKSVAMTTWHHSMGMLFVIATLNYKWAKSGGPRNMEDKLVLWGITVTGTVIGYTYYKVKLFAGLGCLWVAPWLSSIALLWSS